MENMVFKGSETEEEQEIEGMVALKLVNCYPEVLNLYNDDLGRKAIGIEGSGF